MPTLERDGATIYYEESGNSSGYPLLLLAPGGLNSAVPFWHRMPLNPIEAFSDEFRVIAMDQRNAGQSSGPLRTGDAWGMLAADQLAVLDAVGVQQAHTIGCCIGCSFILKLCQVAPERVTSGILMQPIGVDPADPGYFGPAMWTPWGENLISKGADVTSETVDAYGHNLFDTGGVFSVPYDFVKTVKTPLLLMDGDDRAHPKATSVEIAELLPGIERVERWRDADVVASATERMRAFLHANTPSGVR
jgi:pimeloyl-ACP methyl ester carboxylesterase